MKTNVLFLIAASIVLTACDQPQPCQYDYDDVVMVDQTDPMQLYPTVSALPGPLKLKENMWSGVRIKLVAVDDKDVTSTAIISLPKENEYTGNSTLRNAKVARFKEELARKLATFDSIHSCPRSIIFRAVTQQAVSLSQSASPHRQILVYSNLIENSNVNFYDPGMMRLVERNPAFVARKLAGGTALPDLTGVQLWLLYAPGSYRENNNYMAIAHLYEQVFKNHHATVHIGNQFALP